MKKSEVSFIALNRKIVLLLGAALSLALVGFMGWGAIRWTTSETGKFSSGRHADNAPPESESAPGEADDPEGRANWFMYQRMYPFDKVPDGARRRAWDEVLSRGQGLRSQAVGTTWASIGPLPTTSAFPNNGGFTSGRI